MNRRHFLRGAAAAVSQRWLPAASTADTIDLTHCTIHLSSNATARERKSALVLIEEAEKRNNVEWRVQSNPGQGTAIYLGTTGLPNSRFSQAVAAAKRAGAEGYAIDTGVNANGHWIVVAGADERGLLFGVGKLLRTIIFEKERASADAKLLHLSTAPKYSLRGHQIGYRPKTNAYDAWDVPMWEQYIREMALFGTNAIVPTVNAIGPPNRAAHRNAFNMIGMLRVTPNKYRV